MEEPTCPATPPLSKCPDTPPRAGSSKSSPSRWNNTPERKEKSRTPTPNRPSSPENCAICLGPLANKSFTNSCCHQFCFVCLLEWSKVKAECPLCKVEFDYIIHNVRSQDDYDQYHVVRQPSQRATNALLAVTQRHLDVHWPNNARAQYQYRAFSEWMANRGLSTRGTVQDAIPSGPPTRIPPHRGLTTGTSAFRRSIYDRDLWARMQPDVTGRYRECSPEFYSQNQAQMHRLIPFLNRELNVLLDYGARSMYVMEKILEMLPLFSINSTMFRSRVARLIGHQHAAHFCHELRAFASSPYDMVGYDRAVQYHPNGGAGYSIEIEDEESSDNNVLSDDDDDIQIIEPSPEASVPSTNPSTSASATASTSSSGSSSTVQPSSVRNSSVVNVPSDSESDNAEDIQVVGYVKPRSERTPEIITLSSPEHHSHSSSHTRPTRAFSSSHSPNDLICINLGNTSTAEHRWEDNLNDISFDEGSSSLPLWHRHSSRQVNYAEPISSTESSDSPASSFEFRMSVFKSLRKRESARKGKRSSKAKCYKVRDPSSESENDDQPSTSKGRRCRKLKVDNKSTSSRSSKSPKKNVSPLRNAMDSDSDELPIRFSVRSAIVKRTLESSSDNEQSASSSHATCPKVRNLVVTRTTTDEGQDSWRVAENSTSQDSHRTHSSRHERYHSSKSSSHHSRCSPSLNGKYHDPHEMETSPSKRKRNHSKSDRSKSSSHSQKAEKRHKGRSRSPKSHSKRSKKKRRSSSHSENDFDSKSSRRKQRPLEYSDDSDAS